MSLFARLFRRPLPSVTSAPWIPLVLDVRGPDEFVGPLGHIAGARNLPLPDLATQLDQLAGDRRPIVVVCKTDRRSAIAASQLLAAGAAEVSVLRGGMETWRRLGLPSG
jgi:rhodanese-related sulfurtransferase